MCGRLELEAGSGLWQLSDAFAVLRGRWACLPRSWVGWCGLQCFWRPFLRLGLGVGSLPFLHVGVRIHVWNRTISLVPFSPLKLRICYYLDGY